MSLLWWSIYTGKRKMAKEENDRLNTQLKMTSIV